MKIMIVIFMAIMFAGCSILGYRNVDGLKGNATHVADFDAKRSSVLIYRDFLRYANARRNNPATGGYSDVNSELDRSTGNAYVTTLHDRRVIGHVEINHRDSNSAHVKAWWLIGSFYTDCSVRQTADPSLDCPVPKK